MLNKVNGGFYCCIHKLLPEMIVENASLGRRLSAAVENGLNCEMHCPKLAGDFFVHRFEYLSIISA